MRLTETNLKWLEKRFSRGEDGSYFAHEPIYGLEGKEHSEVDPIIRYARIFQVFRFLNRMMPFRNLLDVGGAEGFVAHLARTVFGAQVVTFDLSKEANHRARELFDVDGVAGVAHQLPFKSGAFDVVLCLEVLEHLEGPLQTLLELARVASQHLIVSSVNFSLSEKDRKERLARRRVHFHYDRNCFLKKDLEVLLGSQHLLAVDQHRPFASTEVAAMNRISNLGEAREVILSSCHLSDPATDAQIIVKTKRTSLSKQGPVPERSILERVLTEKIQPGRALSGPPSSPLDRVLQILSCPDCRMVSAKEVEVSLVNEKQSQFLVCETKLHRYNVEGGVPLLYPVTGMDPSPLATLLDTARYSSDEVKYLVELDRQFDVPVSAAHVEGCVDQPAPHETLRRGLTNVRGWAIDFDKLFPLDLDVILDGVLLGSTQNDIPRPDVLAHFERLGIPVPLCSGFLFPLQTQDLRKGGHRLRVVARPSTAAIMIGEVMVEVADESVPEAGG